MANTVTHPQNINSDRAAPHLAVLVKLTPLAILLRLGVWVAVAVSSSLVQCVIGQP